MPSLFDYSILKVADLLPFLATLAAVLGVSFLAGTAIKGIFHLNQYKWMSFSTPIGFLFYLSVLQIGYTFITLREINTNPDSMMISTTPEVYLNFTKTATIVIVIGSIICFYWIWDSIKNMFHWRNLIKPFLAFSLFVLVFSIWKNVRVNYRLDDINFYEPFIMSRTTEYNSQLKLYIFQSFYTFICVLKSWFDQICTILGCAIPQDIVYVLWMPGAICLFLTSFAVVDLEGYVEEKIKFIPAAWIIWLGVAVVTTLDYWYFQMPYVGNTLRHLGIMLAIPLIDVMTRDKKPYLAVVVSIALGGTIACSSSSFFISMFLLYAFAIYAMMKREEHWIEELTIMLFFPLLFVGCYMPQYMNLLRILYFGLVIVCVLLNVFHLSWIETKMKWGAIVILIAVPLAFIVLPKFGYPDKHTVEVMASGAQFWDAVQTKDQVPDLLQIGNISSIGKALKDIGKIQYNLDPDGTKIKALRSIYWIFLAAGAACWWKKQEFPMFMAMVIVLTFYNPFVYDFVAAYMTGAGFPRITDLLYTFPILAGAIGNIASMGELGNHPWTKIVASYACAVIVFGAGIIKYQTFNLPYYVAEDSEDYAGFNYMYKTDQEDIDLVRKLETYIANDDEIDTSQPVYVISQIYGATFFTQTVPIVNTLEDRFSYTVLDTNEYERTFLRRLPGFEVSEDDVDYRHACSLAFSKNVQYILLDGQYDMDLQYGLWPCSNLKDDLGVFKVIKMDGTYWNITLHDGYTLKYKVEDNNVVGIDKDWYDGQGMEVPAELPENKEEQEKALQEMIQEKSGD